jgi:hypothetical protein
MIFSKHLQHHISKLTRNFWSTLRSVQVSAPYEAMFQMQHFTSIFLKCKFNLLVKRAFWLLNVFFHGSNGCNIMCTSYIIYYRATQTVEIFHILKLFWYMIICIGDGCLEIPIILVFSTFISIQQFLPISISLSIKPCSAASSLASSMWACACLCELHVVFWSLKILQGLPWLGTCHISWMCKCNKIQEKIINLQ